MSESATPLQPGNFCWVDVACSDPSKIHKFFSQLFGWGRRVRPTEDANAYSIMTADGEHSAGICGVEEAGASQWMCYLLVDDLRAAAAKAESLGGEILKADVEIKGFGTMTVMQDPTGAIFALWKSERGEAKKPRKHGRLSWCELLTTDPSRASDFYTKLFGWTIQEGTYEGKPHFLFHQDGGEVASMMEDPRSSWVVYFSVDDCQATANLCVEAGGEVCRPPYSVEGLGQCTMLKDPSGGLFGAFCYQS